jgi:Na+/H+ antiporter NhaD/arsenite permease-like protein
MSDVHPGNRGAPGRRRFLSLAAALLGAGALAFLVRHHLTHPHVAPAAAGPAAAPPFWGLGVLPFAGILAAIAILPLLRRTKHWWESNRNRLIVSLAGAGLTLAYVALAEGTHALLPLLDHAIPTEYVPFMTLLFSLYVLSGGISLRGDLPAHPATNTAFLAFGAIIASFIGTTGASMLLIRPLLQTNSERRHVVHTVVFFIFLVANVGGTLLPIGDPPLLLGYLRGVPFLWTTSLWIEWAFCCAVLLVVYFAWDTIQYRRETPRDIRRDEAVREPLRLRGTINLVWLVGVVATVAFIAPGREIPLVGVTAFPFLREIVMLVLVGLSLATTPAGVRSDNRFNYAAIVEVAALFLGIFVTMQVPIEVLRASGGALRDVMDAPWQYFWATGALSSVLDNAPTYVVFFELAKTMPSGEAAVALGAAGELGAIDAPLLTAVSLGAVFMGAMTYIGNGPNFMVKAIAAQSGVEMPSFFGFLFRYSVPLLIPIFVLVTVIFLR